MSRRPRQVLEAEAPLQGTYKNIAGANADIEFSSGVSIDFSSGVSIQWQTYTNYYPDTYIGAVPRIVYLGEA